jgi:hypothetical protein
MKTAKPNPKFWRKPDGVKAWTARMIYCEHYSTCLDIAIMNKWSSFTCKQCSFWNKDKCSIPKEGV